MLSYPEINPIAFQLGSLSVHWYGLMYVIGFVACWIFLSVRIKHSLYPCCLTTQELSDLLFYAALGVVIGGRVGYMLFYEWHTLLTQPLSIFKVWQGGMSFHGGLVGVICVLIGYAFIHKKSWLDLADVVSPAVPLGLAAGRIGNFINGELWGRVTTVPWGMVFPAAGEQPRHPSPLYEFALEGIVLFFMLWIFSQYKRPRGAVSGLFLICYGVMRFFIEFFREPDIQIGFVALGWMTEGQLLCLPMIFLGICLMIWAYKRNLVCSNT